MTRRRTLTIVTAALALIVALLSPTAATAAPPAAPHGQSAFTPGAGDDGQNARLRARLAEALARAAADAVTAQAPWTVYYNDSAAPSYRSLIARSASVWNSSVHNVQLVRTTSSANLSYYEGNDPRGSYASTDGRGNGYVFLDHTQLRTYAPLRVTAHETGHVLGLPDHYSGPCSELMSGGGPGTSCTNAYPDAAERSRVDTLWASLLTTADVALAG
ncbi:MAG TPA: snapalysin family zinc-dependent metalloprotease [Mycobacteriales bacterium]|nr:snapalysin family zinc-dependent metalloprotease [Mycobacteriales bacterium]